jgi:hypothetical protein
MPIETISFDQYKKLFDEYYNLLQDQQIINNLISDAIGSTPQQVYDPTDPESINTYQQEIALLESEIFSMVDKVFDVNKTPEDPAIRSCISDCQ